MQQLQIVTTVTLKDAVSFAFYHYYRTTAGIVPVVICLCCALYFLFLFSGHTEDLSLILYAGFISLIYFLIPAAIYNRTKKSFLSSRRFSEPITWEMDAERIKAFGKEFESQFSWSMVTRVAESNTSFFIYHNNQTASIIPKRNLSDSDISGFQSLVISIPGLISELWMNSSSETIDALRPASRRLRFWNFVLDTLCFSAIYIALTLLFAVIYVFSTPADADAPALVTLLPSLLLIPCYVLYYFTFEYLFQKSPAKFITGTKLIAIGDKPASRKQILKRSLARLIPLEGLSFLFSSEGIHDVFSRTRVIRVTRKTEGGKQ